jgi:hypothetical protein
MDAIAAISALCISDEFAFVPENDDAVRKSAT